VAGLVDEADDHSHDDPLHKICGRLLDGQFEIVFRLKYRGLETCLGGWLPTFALRYGDSTLAVSEYTTLCR
jgi:hypothetical protein